MDGETPSPFRHAVIVAVAPNGARRMQGDHPAVPLTADEIAREAASCAGHGACVLHLHVRDAEGRHLLDADAYGQAMAAVRREVAGRMVIQITTEAAGRYAPAEQMAVVRAVRPEAVSLALRELAPGPDSVPAFAAFMAWMRRERIAAQVILYDRADRDRLADLMRTGCLPDSGWSVLYVLGRYAARQRSTPQDLFEFLDENGQSPFPDWMVCAFGPAELHCLTAAARSGGDVRSGFENNLHLPDGGIAPDNAALVARLTAELDASGLPLADADAVRERWLGPA
jgi:3-keto-5-aminohexanoate cleavage enzyme